MSDLGKAIYMACSVFLFIVAATTSIYLYGTLNEYLEIATINTNVTKRVENVSVYDKKLRKITRAEIYITLYNMEQMHVKSLAIKNGGNIVYGPFTRENMVTIKEDGNVTGFSTFLSFLEDNPNADFTYSSKPTYMADGSFDGFEITYDM